MYMIAPGTRTGAVTVTMAARRFTAVLLLRKSDDEDAVFSLVQEDRGEVVGGSTFVVRTIATVTRQKARGTRQK
jgi:hypothetical protein